MKRLKAICTAAIVALALSVPAYAGEINTPGYTSPAPGTPVVTEPASGEISSPGVASTSPGDAETAGLVELLLAIISIF